MIKVYYESGMTYHEEGYARVTGIKEVNEDLIVITVETEDKYCDVSNGSHKCPKCKGLWLNFSTLEEDSSFTNYKSCSLVIDIPDFDADYVTIVPLKHQYDIILNRNIWKLDYKPLAFEVEEVDYED